MYSCNDCKQNPSTCICSAVDRFFEDNRYLMEDLAELEAMRKAGAKRCLACAFFVCQCAEGLEAKNK